MTSGAPAILVAMTGSRRTSPARRSDPGIRWLSSSERRRRRRLRNTREVLVRDRADEIDCVGDGDLSARSDATPGEVVVGADEYRARLRMSLEDRGKRFDQNLRPFLGRIWPRKRAWARPHSTCRARIPMPSTSGWKGAMSPMTRTRRTSLGDIRHGRTRSRQCRVMLATTSVSRSATSPARGRACLSSRTAGAPRGGARRRRTTRTCFARRRAGRAGPRRHRRTRASRTHERSPAAPLPTNRSAERIVDAVTPNCRAANPRPRAEATRVEPQEFREERGPS